MLEILVATLLASALLAMLWGAFNMYLRMFETGERVTREAQLLMGMSRQFSESIQGVPALSPPPTTNLELSFSTLPSPFSPDSIESDDPQASTSFDLDEFDASPPLEPLGNRIAGSGLAFGPSSMSGGLGASGPSDSAVALPTFGLVGSFDRLTVYGVQLVPDPNTLQQLSEPSNSTPTLPGVVEDIPPGANELRTIHFRFIQPELSANRAADTASHRGLLRIDTAWHQVDASQWTDEQMEEVLVQAEQESGMPGAAGVELQISRLRRERDGVSQLLPDQLLLFSEVAGIKFRYFDGTFWHDAWDSRLEDRLPLAVEIFLQFREEKLRREQLRRRNLERQRPGTRDEGELEDAELDEDWNTLELYDPDGVTSNDFAAESENAIFRLLVLCAGAATDARRSSVTGSTMESPPLGESAPNFPGGP
jgi:hypothetical protein